MEPSRRDFHKGLLALLLMGTSQAAAAPVAADILVLNRLTFGATPQDRARFAKLGLAGWLESELAQPVNGSRIKAVLEAATLHISYESGRNENGGTWDAVDEMRPLKALRASSTELLPLIDYELPLDYTERARPAQEVVAASLLRAVNSDAQLREMMTAFWHEHFSANAYANDTSMVFFPVYDRMLRGHAFGNFRAMIGDVARSPVMLTYLNNEASRASPANENYARELLELHTLGIESYHNDLYDNWREVPGATEGMAAGYIDQDVYEVARAFTGWSIGDGRWLEDGVNAPKTGAFHYVQHWHDPYQKRVLGVEFPPNRGPMEDGDQVLDILAAHPGTARHIALKLLRRFGIEAPSEAYHQAVADSFLAHKDAPDQIAQMIRRLVLHPEFMQTPPTKMRRPFEYLAAILRASGADVTAPSLNFDWHLNRAGWSQHAVRPPTGHSDKTEDWANTRTLNGIISLALYAHKEWMELQESGSGAMDPDATLESLARQTEVRFGVPEGAVTSAVAQMGVERFSGNPDKRSWVVSIMHAAAALHPQFVLR